MLPVADVELDTKVVLCSVPPEVELTVFENHWIVSAVPVAVPEPELHVLYV